MKISQTGIILYTIAYQETVKFYQSVFNLDVLYSKKDLTCFDFHGSYLMIEVDDSIEENYVDMPSRDKFCVRFNVPDVKEACQALEKFGVPYSYNEFDWGTIAKFRDPDGNMIGLRSSKEHEEDSNQKD